MENFRSGLTVKIVVTFSKQNRVDDDEEKIWCLRIEILFEESVLTKTIKDDYWTKSHGRIMFQSLSGF